MVFKIMIILFHGFTKNLTKKYPALVWFAILYSFVKFGILILLYNFENFVDNSLPKFKKNEKLIFTTCHVVVWL